MTSGIGFEPVNANPLPELIAAEVEVVVGAIVVVDAPDAAIVVVVEPKVTVALGADVVVVTPVDVVTGVVVVEAVPAVVPVVAAGTSIATAGSAPTSKIAEPADIATCVIEASLVAGIHDFVAGE